MEMPLRKIKMAHEALVHLGKKVAAAVCPWRRLRTRPWPCCCEHGFAKLLSLYFMCVCV